MPSASWPARQRIGLRRLSAAAVQELSAASGADAGAVLSATGGSPFFVSEVLANLDEPVPATVRDAVLACLEGLSDGTGASLELFSTILGQVERWLSERPRPSTRGPGRGRAARAWRPTRPASGSAIELGGPPGHRAAAAADRPGRLPPAGAGRPGQAARGRAEAWLAHHAHHAGEPEEVVRSPAWPRPAAAAAGAFSEALAHYDLVLRWSGCWPRSSGRPSEEASRRCTTCRASRPP